MDPALPVLLYDDDCGFCTRTARLVPRLGVRCRIAALGATDLPALGVDPQRAQREMPFVDRRGAVSYGHHAWAGVLRTGPLPCRLAGRLLEAPGVSWAAARVYAWIAGHRQLMPGGTAACRLPR